VFRLACCSLALGLLLAFASACGSSKSGSTATPQRTPARLSGGITVFAASSLTDAFNDEKHAFEAANPGASVTMQFGGSATLVTQLQQGARADVLATAATKNMDDALANGSVVDAGKTFVKNRLAVIVPHDNPANITSPFDLAKSGVKLDLVQQGVPAGDYARQIFMKMEADPLGGAGFSDKVLGNVVSNEANVKEVVSKVQLGEVDAGIVYVTDVTADVASAITLVTIPDSLNVVATYPIAVVKDAGNVLLAQALVDFILSAPGQQILQRYGFLPAQ
jgi:molybdate transport system substrate-binding protein